MRSINSPIVSKNISSSWRLIPFLEAPGAVQMAIDAWLLKQHQLGKHPPTLRFYTFSPVALSLGHLQRRYPPEWHALRWQDTPIDLVRRPSGGRAVLHQGDLTYMIVTSGMPKNVNLAYQQICQFLIRGFETLGVKLSLGKAGENYLSSANCFATSTGADLVNEQGVKVIGSAQRRDKNAILQHGSIRLNQDSKLLEEVFKIAPSQPLKLPFAEDREKQILTLIDALTQAAGDYFGCRFEVQSLTASEWKDIHELIPIFRGDYLKQQGYNSM